MNKDISSSLFAVIGVPRSGTTLLCNIINSFDNSFCLSEPHWSKILSPKGFRLDKLAGAFKFESTNGLMGDLKSFMDNSEYSWGGVKETYRIWQPESITLPYNSKDLAFIFFIFRDPLSVYNSGKKWGGKYCHMPSFVKNYISLANDYLILKGIDAPAPNLISGTVAAKSGVVPIGLCYEDLCTGGIEYLKKQFLLAGINIGLEYDGPFRIRATNYVFGDRSANKGGEIGRPVISKNNLTKQEEKILRDKLYPLYEHLRSLTKC